MSESRAERLFRILHDEHAFSLMGDELKVRRMLTMDLRSQTAEKLQEFLDILDRWEDNERLKDKTEATSYTEVIRRALKEYEDSLAEARA